MSKASTPEIHILGKRIKQTYINSEISQLNLADIE